MCTETKIASDGKNVIVEHAGKRHSFRYKKSWDYLLELIKHPDHIFPIHIFMPTDGDSSPIHDGYDELVNHSRHKLGISILGENERDYLCDVRTITEVKDRLNTLIQREAELRLNNDHTALADILDEKEKLVEYLKDTITPSGIRKRNPSEYDAFRKNLNRTILRTLSEIGEVFPELESILKRQIMRGSYLQYIPGEHEITFS